MDNVNRFSPDPRDAASAGRGVRPTKREWLHAYLAGLEKHQYAGRVQITLEFNRGGITKATVLRQEEIGPDKPYAI